MAKVQIFVQFVIKVWLPGKKCTVANNLTRFTRQEPGRVSQARLSHTLVG